MVKDLGTVKELRRLAMGRSNIYYLLSSVFLNRPSYKVIKVVLNEDFLFGISRVIDDDRGVKLLKRFAKNFRHSRKEYEALANEYRELFLASGSRYVIPYETAYREEDVLEDVKNMFRVARINTARLHEPLDHFGIELWFMYCICYMEARGWTKRNRDFALRCLEMGREFLENHLLLWAGKLCDQIIVHSKLDFYKGVAGITKGYIKQDYIEVKEAIKEARDLT